MAQTSIKKRGAILKSSLMMAIATFCSRILGLVREQSIATMFGVSFATDAFMVAYRIPNLLRDLFAEGVFSSAFVPVFTEKYQESQREARELFWAAVIVLGSLTLFISGIVIVFAPEIVGLMAKSFKSDLNQFHLAVNLTRIMAPFLAIISVSALFMGVLNTLKMFFLPALAPALFNVGFIACIWILPSLLKSNNHDAIYALAIGVLVGGFFQLLLQFPSIIKRGWGPVLPTVILTKSLKKIFSKLGPGIIGLAATQINLIVNTILATGTVVGAVSWLTYAFRLFQFPVGILSVSISGSNLVHFSNSWKRGEKNEAIDHLRSSYILSWVTIIPAMVLGLSLAAPSVHLIFERGAFTFSDVVKTSLVLKLYFLGLPSYGLYKIFTPVFYTLDKQKIPVAISSSTVFLNIIFCMVLVKTYSYPVLALGTSLSIILNSLIQGGILFKLLNLQLSFFLNKTIIVCLVSGICTYLWSNLLTMLFFDFGGSFLEKTFVFIIISTSSIALYAGLLWLLGEFSVIKRVLTK